MAETQQRGILVRRAVGAVVLAVIGAVVGGVVYALVDDGTTQEAVSWAVGFGVFLAILNFVVYTANDWRQRRERRSS